MNLLHGGLVAFKRNYFEGSFVSVLEMWLHCVYFHAKRNVVYVLFEGVLSNNLQLNNKREKQAGAELCQAHAKFI